jgi:cobalt-zinc-cadmium resistance protein CzcA
LAIKVFGDDGHELSSLANQMVGILKQIPGAADVITSQTEGAQYYQVKIDELAAGRMGLTVEDILPQLKMLIEGEQVGTVYKAARRTAIVIKGEEKLRLSPAEFAQLRLVLPNNQLLPLDKVAHLERVDGPVSIKREMGKKMSVVVVNVSGRDLVSFVNDAKQQVAEQLSLPVGYSLSWGGQFENQQRAAQRLAIVVPVALLMIFLLLFTTFRSIKQAVLIMSNVPFAMIGGIVALWLTGEYLSVPASVGFIALLGIAVLNGVVMVSFFNELLAKGMQIEQVVREGAMRRLRPVMMTATIAAFGLVPLLFATGPGSEIQRPLAIVVIGGLVSATALTLVLLPLLFRRFGDIRP